MQLFVIARHELKLTEKQSKMRYLPDYKHLDRKQRSLLRLFKTLTVYRVFYRTLVSFTLLGCDTLTYVIPLK